MLLTMQKVRDVTFIRHSDLSDGDACHDEIIRRRKAQ